MAGARQVEAKVSPLVAKLIRDNVTAQTADVRRAFVALEAQHQVTAFKLDALATLVLELDAQARRSLWRRLADRLRRRPLIDVATRLPALSKERTDRHLEMLRARAAELNAAPPQKETGT